MTKSKNQNPIEEAIGDRAKTPKTEPVIKSLSGQKIFQDGSVETPETPSQVLRDAPDQPLTKSEMLSLEELNRRTEKRLQDPLPGEPIDQTITQTERQVLVLQPDPPPVTKTSSPESPPQKSEKMPVTAHDSPRNWDELDEIPPQKKVDIRKVVNHINNSSVECPDCGECNSDDHRKHIKQYNKMAEKIGIPKIIPVDKDADLKAALSGIHEAVKTLPAEDVELTALKKYILEDGFVLATVAWHIVSLCAEPMMTPSTTMWDFRDRAQIPDMVLALLNQPGYIEGIWPSLRIVMSSNKGNAAWCAGIATTLAFFDTIRVLPALKELKNDETKK